MTKLVLDLDDIQGDVLTPFQKDVENFVFFKIVDKISFKDLAKRHIVGRVTNAQQAHERELTIERRKRVGARPAPEFVSLNIGFSKDGLSQLIGGQGLEFDPAFARGAANPYTTKILNDPPCSTWMKEFVSERIDGIFFITGRYQSTVVFHSNELLRLLDRSIKVVYSEMGNTRPGAERGHEHFGFLDGISQPGIRGLTRNL